MPDLKAKRTLVKSPPELWAELSETDGLARHFGEFGEIRITKVEPETAVAWEGEHASGTVEIEASGWGTKVTLTASVNEIVRAESEQASPSNTPPTAGEAPATASEAAPSPTEAAPSASEPLPPASDPAPASTPRLARNQSMPIGRQAPSPSEPTPPGLQQPPAQAPRPPVAQAPSPVTPRYDPTPRRPAAPDHRHPGAAPERRGFLGRLLGRRPAPEPPRPGYSAQPLARPPSQAPPRPAPPVPDRPAFTTHAPFSVDRPTAPDLPAPQPRAPAPPTSVPAPPATAPAPPPDRPTPEPPRPAGRPEPPPPAPEPKRQPDPRPANEALDPERALAVLEDALDNLGSAHHRPFSRG